MVGWWLGGGMGGSEAYVSGLWINHDSSGRLARDFACSGAILAENLGSQLTGKQDFARDALRLSPVKRDPYQSVCLEELRCSAQDTDATRDGVFILWSKS